MKTQFFHLEKEQVKEVQKMCKPGFYCVINKACIPSIIPEKLKEKCPQAVVIASACDRGTVYAINLQRLDPKDKAVDQMPYALVAVPDNAASSCLLHHADYQGRTTHPDETFWQMVYASGVENYIQVPESPPNMQGPLSELKGSSHERGFSKATLVINEHDNTLGKEEGK